MSLQTLGELLRHRVKHQRWRLVLDLCSFQQETTTTSSRNSVSIWNDLPRLELGVVNSFSPFPKTSTQVKWLLKRC